jgi:hypothetical protein
MALTFPCSCCRALLRAPERLAGQRLPCPRCAAAVVAPAYTAAAVAEQEPLFAVLEDEELTTCAACARRIAVSDTVCPYCGIGTGSEPSGRPRFVACPQCGATGATRVVWTLWGSFYGTALFHHVRCPACEYCYNGKTGNSNLIPAIVFVTVPALLIAAILWGLFSWVGFLARQP